MCCGEFWRAFRGPGSTGMVRNTSTTSCAGWNWLPTSNRRLCVRARSSFDYAVIRGVPRVERGEFVNAGIILFSLEKKFLEARIHLDEARLKALWPEIDLALV